MPGLVLEMAETRWALARALQSTAPDRARNEATQARELYAELGEAWSERTRAIDIWLAGRNRVAARTSNATIDHHPKAQP